MNPTLILIDIQKGFLDKVWGVRNNEVFEARVEALLKNWRQRNWPVIHVRHDSVNPKSPLRPKQIGNEFMGCAQPRADEVVIGKQVNSAFIGTNLMDLLLEMGAKDLVIAGLCTDHCVSTTTRMGANLGFEVTVVADAVATFGREAMDGEVFGAELVHRVALASLEGEFAKIKNTNEVCFNEERFLCIN